MTKHVFIIEGSRIAAHVGDGGLCDYYLSAFSGQKHCELHSVFDT